MTHRWFIVTAAAVAAFTAEYDSRGIGETVGLMQANADATLYFTGTNRCPPETADEIALAVSGVTVSEAWPPPGGWTYPTPE